MITLAAFTALVILTATLVLTSCSGKDQHKNLSLFHIPIAILIFVAAVVALKTFSHEMVMESSLFMAPQEASQGWASLMVLRSLFGAILISGLMCLVIWVGMGLARPDDQEKNQDDDHLISHHR